MLAIAVWGISLATGSWAEARVPTDSDVSIRNSIGQISQVGKPSQGLPCGSRSALRAPTSINGGPKKFPVQCKEYMDDKGVIPPNSKGAFIAGKLEKDPDYYSELLDDAAGNTPSMKRICPGFKDMSRSERIQFWVYSFGAISKTESNCGTNNRAKGMNGNIATGEFQLEEARRSRVWRGRSWGAKGACAVSSVSKFEANASCALDIMVGEFNGEYGRPPGLASNSYWQELKVNTQPSRWQTSPIIKAIKNFPLCK